MSTITAPGFAAREPAAIEALVALAEAQPTPASVFARQLAAIMASSRTARRWRAPSPAPMCECPGRLAEIVNDFLPAPG